MFENHHIKSALSKLLIRQKPLTSNFEYFCECLNNFVKQINPSESEEFNKNLIAEFLGKSFYGKTNHINTKDRIDLAIYANTQNTSAVQVIIEVKSPSNRTEFSTCENINSKALQETVLYFLRERITDNNLEIKHIIITNNYEWFVFNAADFDRLFAQNKTLVKQFKDFETGTLSAEKTSVFYNEIAKPAIEQVKENLPFAYFNVTEKKTKAELIDIYKLLSPQHLLKQQFYNDSNSLNVAFYNELLHIIGLEEKDDAGKKLICRKEAGSRNAASLLESVIYQLGDYESNEERLFDIALNLTITWINRILFLKLLESQMLSYHAQQEPAAYKFLDFKTIPDYDNLNELFFKVLAIPVAERNTQVSQKYSRVPYLNSSLFERTPNEQKYFLISGLKAGKMALSKQTVLKDHTGNALKGDLDTLDYLFRFLDAYDFGSDTSEELTKEASKTLINASVLGLIFEKINGYKDGSFFTPGTITQFMCRETLRRTVVQKFNNAKGWNCTDFTTLYNQIDNITEANNIVNSLKICDPAVGSGHFLVSALNEIIAIKNDLHILQDKNGLRLKEYDITVENDELMIHDENGEPFVYNPLNKESQRIQETLFNEKQTIIEHCLFGVDLNPNSVNICRLRLWIELLKNAYYIDGSNDLQTLPNIDINIKCGNSLVSRFALDADLGQALRHSKWSIASYQTAVSTYHNAHNKEEKHKLEELIESIKGDFKSEISKKDPLFLRYTKVKGELFNLTQQVTLFDRTEKEKKQWNDDVKKLTTEVTKLEAQIEEIKNNKIYEKALEWRFEFPEVLDDDGNFVGFDCVIGNPPYIQLQNNGGTLANELEGQGYETFARTGDIYCCFYERGIQLLKQEALECFITSNKWMRAGYGEATRKFFAEKTNPQLLVDFSGVKIFDSATVDTNILLLQKAKNKSQTLACVTKSIDCKNNLSDYVRQNASVCSFLGSDSWVILSPIEQSIKQKIEKVGTPLKDWDINIYRGILTGCNEAFIISGEKKNEILANCKTEEERAKTDELIRPILRGRDIKRYGYEFADLWLIWIPWHFPLHLDNTIQGASPKAEQEFQKLYPAVYNHLLQYKKQLSARNKAETGIRYEWYALQRWGANYWEDFYKQKIVWKRVGSILRFSYDESACFALDSTCFATGKFIPFLVSVFNSPMGHYLLKDAPKTGTGDLLISVQAVEPALIPIPDNQNRLIDMATDLVHNYSKEKELIFNKLIYRLYNLMPEEIDFIENRED